MIAMMVACAIALALVALLHVRGTLAPYSTLSRAALDAKKKYLHSLEKTCAAAGGAANARNDDDGEPQVRRPNVVIFLADDMGFDINAHWGARIRTPNIDALARTGVVLDNFYAAASVCTPSRAGLLTGRLPPRTGAGGTVYFPRNSPISWLQWLAGYSMGLLNDEITIGDALGAAGYSTSLIGKWHLGSSDPHLPNDAGFQQFFGAHYSNDMSPFDIWRNRDVAVNDVYTHQDNVTDMYADEAVRFASAAAAADDPFFLLLSFNSPHDPLYSSETQAARHNADGRSPAGLYGDAVEDIDRAVGAVLGALDAAGAADNTLVWLTSDNGPWYEGSTRAGRNGASPLRGRKATPFEGGFRVPGIVRWPAGGIGAARSNPGAGQPTECCATYRAPAHFMDVLPTVLGACGVARPHDRVLDGDDLLAALRRAWAKRGSDSAVAGADGADTRPFYYFLQNSLVALRRGHWKLHLPHLIEPAELVRRRTFGREGPRGGTEEGGWMWLSDLAVPGESYDHTLSRPRVAEAMYDEAVKWKAAFEANPRGWISPHY